MVQGDPLGGQEGRQGSIKLDCDQGVATVHLELEVGETGFPAPTLLLTSEPDKTGFRHLRSSSTPSRQHQPALRRRRRSSEGGLAAVHSWLVGRVE